MKAQQIGSDLYLFFNRTGEKFMNGKIVGGELSNKPGRLETELLDSDERPLGKQVIVIKKENDAEMGVKVSFPSEGIIEVMFSELAYGLLKTYNELFATIPDGDGTCRILYAPMKS